MQLLQNVCHVTVRIDPYYLGEKASRVGEYDLALKHYGRDPSAEALAGCGDIFSMQKNWGEAERYYRRAIQLHPNFVAALCGLANTFVGREMYRRALEYYGQAMKIDPNCAHAHLGLAGIFEKTREYPKALEHLAQYFQHRGFWEDDGDEYSYRIADALARRLEPKSLCG